MLKSGPVGDKTVTINGTNVKSVEFNDGEARYTDGVSLRGRVYPSSDGTLFEVLEFSNSGRYYSQLSVGELTTDAGVTVRISS
jgi:hypothetical protein